MPIVRIEMLPGRSLAQKRELVRVITDAVCNIAHTRPQDTLVLFSEYAVEDWATRGQLYIDQEDDEEAEDGGEAGEAGGAAAAPARARAG